jgi:hypothetical protein
VPTDLEMDAEAFTVELGDRYMRCPQCQRTHLWTKTMAWLEEAPMDEHGNEEGSQDSLLRPRRPGLVKSILIADGDERVSRLFAEVFPSHEWRATWYSDGPRAASASNAAGIRTPETTAIAAPVLACWCPRPDDARHSASAPHSKLPLGCAALWEADRRRRGLAHARQGRLKSPPDAASITRRSNARIVCSTSVQRAKEAGVRRLLHQALHLADRARED